MDVRRYILTGAPGAGKTTVALALRARGHHVVDEAATDVIAASPHERPHERHEEFLDLVVHLQRHRQEQAGGTPVQLFDRSPLCTLALARYLARFAVVEPTPALVAEVRRVQEQQVYQRLVFLIQPIGFVTPTAARRITYQQSLVFAGIHEEVYLEHGYDLLAIPPGTVQERVAMIEERLP
ncbi:AAA family ATPase [Dactylosporangium sp. NPDC049742]|uniref:AAA family ATPase n=1 Tax=Dactylosporangium sp. NPDC049742 TaxID=3154737 RepID=UPI0034241CAC